jgi:predicted regulator of Ras-like GTPase activity (Roadblock/LC7/MglB family)
MPSGATSWSLEDSDSRRIERLLHAFLLDSRARCALLVDRSGQLIVSVGERPEFDPTAFASLAAADFSANDQLASMLGEPDFSSLFHQGEKESMYLADVAKSVILVVLFDERATLGLIRIRVREVVRELSEVFRVLLHRDSPRSLPRLERTWADEAELEIDRLFGGAR